VTQITGGVLTQLYNMPVDLWIESRLLDEPGFGPLVYRSVKAQLEQGINGGGGRPDSPPHPTGDLPRQRRHERRVRPVVRGAMAPADRPGGAV